MKIETVVVGIFQVNCFVVWDEQDRRALVIDPGEDGETVLARLKKHELSVASYLLTHGHVDHISGLADMCDVCPAKVGIHSADAKWAFEDVNGMAPFYPAPRRPSCEQYSIEDGEELVFGELVCKVMSTPGHTPGSVCFLFPEERVLFSGDTLFQGSIGRTDLIGGNAQQMKASLKSISGLPADIVVYPGHGASTDMEIEKRTNFFLQ